MTAGLDSTPAKLRRRGLRRQGSARLRLTATFSAVLIVVGLSIVASVVLSMRFIPDYRISAVDASISLKSVEPTSPNTTWPPAQEPLTDEGEAVPSAGTGDLEAAVTISDERDLLRVLLRTSLIVLIFAVALGNWMSWVLAGRFLRPVEHLANAAREAEHGAKGSFRHRLASLAPGRADDEFGRLATTFDDMLDRLDRSYEAQRRFAANASHELRTPLATTQAMLDAALALEKTAPIGSMPESLTRRLREMNTRSIKTVEALLTLSEAQSGKNVATEKVDLASVAHDICLPAQQAAIEAQVDLRRTLQPAEIVGDRELLIVLVGNLVRNAVMHNHPGGWVDVTTGTDSCGRPRLHVANGGAVLASSEVERLTEPFYRSAGRLSGSHGLGLALVAAITELHGGTLTLTAPASGGLTASLDFAHLP